MLRLDLIRHSRAERDSNFNQDFFRTISNRGAQQLNELIQTLQTENKWEQPYIYTSSSLRTFTTAMCIIKNIHMAKASFMVEDKLYLASLDFLIGWIQEKEFPITNLVIIGHNDGLSELLSYLTSSHQYMPTCSWYGLKLHIDSWKSLHSGCADIIRTFHPQS